MTSSQFLVTGKEKRLFTLTTESSFFFRVTPYRCLCCRMARRTVSFERNIISTFSLQLRCKRSHRYLQVLVNFSHDYTVRSFHCKLISVIQKTCLLAPTSLVGNCSKSKCSQPKFITKSIVKQIQHYNKQLQKCLLHRSYYSQ